jgi:type I restriction enzyme S subunit
MQIQNKKEGYGLEETDFGKYKVPDNWKIYSLSDLCRVRKSNSIESELYIGLEHIGKGTNKLELRGHVNDFTSTKNVFVKGDVLYGKLRPLLNKVWLATENGYCSTDILPLIPNEKVLDVIMMYILSSSRFVAYATSKSAGTKMPRINWNDIMEFKVPLPPLEEQQGIASILAKVDDLIQKTDEIIEQTQRLKKGLMESLLTRGINHTRFKKVNIGKKFLNVTIPESWNVKKFGDVLKVRETFIDLDDSADYTRVTVRRKHDGVIVRDIVKGKDILTKNQYRVYGGDFIISRRQIIHNACGLVPKELDGAVVSNEYSCFTGTEYLDLDYMDWFSRTKLFQQTIIVTTHGVAIEKYVFLLKEWLKLFIPLPPIEEQRKIVSILSAINNDLLGQLGYKQWLEKLRKALTQDLMTGKIRVKV